MTSLPPEQAQQPAPPQLQHFTPPAPAPPAGTNSYAIAAFIVSFFGLIGVVLGTIFGLIALRDIRRTGQKGKSFAIVALCISGAWLLAIVALVAIGIVSNVRDRASGVDTVLPDRLKTGQCIRTVDDESVVYTLPIVACTQPHEAEVVGSFELTGSSYPGETKIGDEAFDRCDQMVADYASQDGYEDTTEISYLYPRSSDWRKGERTVTCLAITVKTYTKSVRE